MIALEELVSKARSIARAENDERARRWLASVASMLADWGGDTASGLLKQVLPATCFQGSGSKGRSWADAERAAGGDPRLALVQEAELRSGQPDPRNVAMMLMPLLGIVKDEVARARGPEAVVALVGSLPGPVQDAVRSASAAAPWAVRSIPQSYARPASRGHH